jgi:predicted sulfurtransferase
MTAKYEGPHTSYNPCLSAYCTTLGRFDGQSVQGKGAQYIDPKMRKSTDFPAWVKESSEQLKGKRVMMYCT